MAQAGIDVSDLEKLLKRLGASKETIRREVRTAIEKSIKTVQTKMQDYPPELPNQRYVRTYQLQRGWGDESQVVIEQGAGFNVRATITNHTPYSPQVQSALEQTGLFKGRWESDEAVAKEVQPECVEHFVDAIQAIVDDINKP